MRRATSPAPRSASMAACRWATARWSSPRPTARSPSTASISPRRPKCWAAEDMPILESQVDRNSDDYKRNRDKMLAAIAEFRAAEASVQATSEKSRDRFAKRKQLMPRERIALLLDRGAPFLELMPLAGYRMHDDKDGSSAGGGSVAGIGYVEGVRCVVSASNSAIKGGTVAPSGQRKGQRVQQSVLENKLPLVHLVESR